MTANDFQCEENEENESRAGAENKKKLEEIPRKRREAILSMKNAKIPRKSC